jgi:hypothetical protein
MTREKVLAIITEASVLDDQFFLDKTEGYRGYNQGCKSIRRAKAQRSFYEQRVCGL